MKLSKITFLSHTADICIKIEGASLEELFQLGLSGMNRIIKKDFCQSVRDLDIHMDLELESSDKTTLLIDFLSEVLTSTHIDQVIYCQVDFTVLSTHRLKCKLRGKKVALFDEDVKAVTYHEAEVIVNEQGRWGTQIIFDV